MQFSRNGPKKNKKALCLSVKVDGVLRLCKMSKMVLEHFGASRKVDKIPYKTCRLLILLGHFRKMAQKSIKKALRFTSKVDDVL